MRPSALALVALLLAGCGAATEEGWSGLKTPFIKPVTTVSYPIGEFSLAYADIKAAYVLLAREVAMACKAAVISPDGCNDLAVARAKIETIDAAARNSIRLPGTTIDWAAIGDAIRQITALAISLGVPGGGVLTKVPEVLGGAGGVIQRLQP